MFPADLLGLASQRVRLATCFNGEHKISGASTQPVGLRSPRDEMLGDPTHPGGDLGCYETAEVQDAGRAPHAAGTDSFVRSTAVAHAVRHPAN